MVQKLPVELMRTLDEKFIGDWATFQTMRPCGALVVAGETLRTAEGALDHAAAIEHVRHVVAQWPALRMRVRPMPLGVTTPVWEACEPDLAWHVRFLDECPPERVDAVLGGAEHGLLELDRPLWVVLVVGLPDGDVAFVPQVQHALGDGIFAMRFIEHLTADAPFDPRETPPPEPLVSPRTAVGVLAAAFGSWWRTQGSLPAAWREYTRKSFVRRLRRTGGRILRPGRMRRQSTTPPPSRHHAFTTLELREVKLAAREAGCSVHDALVTGALRAVDELVAHGSGAALLVPVSRRAGTTGDERNNISMTRVQLPPGTERADAVATVASQVAAAASGEGGAAVEGPAPGYVSYLPWRVRPRYAGQALVRTLVLWPVLDPRHDFSVFAGSYAGTFSIAVSGTEEATVIALRDRIAAELLAAAPAPIEVPA
ncbi:wax ester/triacylglycerol synthase domain-containing protein [Protaetiibacter intestinalis]|uniref:O-acyltransferase WSD1-like N-terminal domain-containing protein n=1 Tax=Protaetiibacter intestinalis TaxID=2419774 RepID=A0A387BCT1_9MICO|nr:wax ester/triacylglycerol synthase domain-containing protein [Protaetiibacter intestinalis]AYF98926.1 hypothetical protein D7I47_12120 [Protaetiibacter intestinalis]